MLILALFAAPALFAVGSGNGVLKNGAMDGVMADVVCKTNFNVGVLESYKEVSPMSASVLDPLIETIQSDTSQLQSYADSNDTESFRSFLKDTYEKDSHDAKEDLSALRRNLTLDNATREELRSDFEQLKNEYQSCHVAAVRLFASIKADLYDMHLEKVEDKIRTLEDKGVDSQKMRSLVEAARSSIVTPLRDAINSGDSARMIRSATRDFCLYGGCNNGTAFHLAAKFEIEKLEGILARVQSMNVSNVSELVAQAQTHLDNAKASLDLNSSDHETEVRSWSEIRLAAQTIQTIVREVNANKMNERREEVRDRVEEIRNATRERVEEIRNATRERVEEIRNSTAQRVNAIRNESHERIDDRLNRSGDRGSNEDRSGGDSDD